MIQIQKKDVIFDTNKSKVTLFRSENGDFIRFNLFPVSGKENLVSSLDELRVLAKLVPNAPGFASKSNIQRSTLAPVSLQVETKKSEFSESQTLGSLSIIKPTLSSLRFYVPGQIADSVLLQAQQDDTGYTLSQSLLASLQEDGSISNPGKLIARIPRDRISRKGIPINLALDTFISENQQIIIQLLGTKLQKTVCSQVLSVSKMDLLGSDQTVQKITTLNFTRADRSKVIFTAYVKERSKNASVIFIYRVWSYSQKYNNRLRQTSVKINPADRSASISITCTEKEYAEVYAIATDGSGRVCGQPVRSLITPSYKIEDLDSIVLRQKDLSGISGEALGIPAEVTRIKVVRKNLTTKIDDVLGFFPVVNGRAQFFDSQAIEQFYPSFSTRFSYEVYLEKAGSLTKSNHSLDVDFNLIDDAYVFAPDFNQENENLTVSMSPKTKESYLDALTKDLSNKSLTEAFSNEIGQIRSQTAEKILYDVYSVSEESGEQNYIGEFSEDTFSLKVSSNQSIFVLPKTSTPRQQISAIKKLIQQPQLVSRSRVARTSAKTLASSLDESVVIDDGVKPKIYNSRSLIDGLISDSQSSKTSNLTGHVFCYSVSSIQQGATRFTGVRAFRTSDQHVVATWSCSSSSEFSHFVVSLLIGNISTQLYRIPFQKNLLKYQIVDPVGGKIPGRLVYSITPFRFNETEGLPVLIRVDEEEVQIA